MKVKTVPEYFRSGFLFVLFGIIRYMVDLNSNGIYAVERRIILILALAKTSYYFG
jgi:hypothetical protein